jgi:rubrerythrin
VFNNLEEVDTDGALRQAAEDVAGDSRLGFLKKAGLAGGAVMGGGAVLAALAPSAMAAALAGGKVPSSVFGKGDLAILRFALTLEYLERGYYEEATSKNITSGDAPLTSFLKTVTADEKAHVAFLSKALGKEALKEPKFNFSPGLTSKSTFAATAYALENTGVKAYLGQAGNIKTPAYLVAAASIVTIEARHAGAIAQYLQSPKNPIAANGAFDPTNTSADAIVKIVDNTKFITKLYPIS